MCFVFYMCPYAYTYAHTCMHAHTYRHTNTYIQAHTHTGTYIHTYIHTNIHAYIQAYRHIHTHTRTHTQLDARAAKKNSCCVLHDFKNRHWSSLCIHLQPRHTHRHTYIHAYMYTYAHTNTQTQTHTHTHTHTAGMRAQRNEFLVCVARCQKQALAKSMHTLATETHTGQNYLFDSSLCDHYRGDCVRMFSSAS